jgi:sulfatase modifying factor 1
MRSISSSPSSPSSPVSTFEKVLRAYGTGGFTYADVVAQLERLIAIGASPAAMLEILRRRERIEPFPEYAHVEVVRLLNAAIAKDAAEAAASAEAHDPDTMPDQSFDSAGAPDGSVPDFARQLSDQEMLTRSYERVKEAEAATASRASALAADLAAARGLLELEQSRRRDSERALAESVASNDAARLRAAEATRESKRYQTEFSALRDALAARDATIARLQNSLAERDAQLAALQQEHARRVPLLEARANAGTQQEGDTQAARARSGALAAELAAARSALQSEQSKCRDTNKALAESLAQLEVLRKEHAKIIPVLETRAKVGTQSAADLPAARMPDAVALEQNASKEAAALLGARLALSEFDVHAARGEMAAMNTASPFSLGALRSWARNGGQGWTPRSITRLLMVSFAVVVLAVVAWFLAQRTAAPTQPSAPASAAVAAPGTAIRDCPTCPSMVVLPAGRILQGASRTDSVSTAFEMPPHWVVIGRPLGMSANVVTVDEFQQFIAATGRDMQGCETYDGQWKSRPESSWKSPGFSQTGTHPVTCVSWNDAKAYAQWLSTQTGHQYRLPSASEWEYAARSGGEAVQPWSANGSAACANANVADASAAQRYPGWTVFACNDGYVYTAPVGSFKTNLFGLNDMLGNVFQWTEDCWHADYVGAPIDGSARSDGDCSEHELRGGSWFSTPAYVRANYRNHFAKDYRTSSVGIRLVRDIES